MENKDLKQIVLIVAMLVVGILLLGVNFWLGAIIGFAIIAILIVLAMAYNKCRD